MTQTPTRRKMNSPNKLKLGLFGANCSSGRVVTTAPERWPGSWEACLQLAKMADQAGIEFMLPIARWKGYGGDTDFQGTTLETNTWAAGLLAATKNLTVFSTMHVPLFHPVVAAKQMVTADHIGSGRFGLNIVCGWNEDEFEMMGLDLREHDTRYEYAQEWLDAVEQMWFGEDDFDFNGRFFNLRKVRAKPKPHGGTRPFIMNAALSPVGQAFAVRNCDALFSNPPSEGGVDFSGVVNGTKALARQQNREVDVYTVAAVTCRPTEKEARDYHHSAVLGQADWTAVDALISVRIKDMYALPPEELQKIRTKMALGQGGTPMIGDPDQVAASLVALANSGITGIGLSLVNYVDELPYFCDEVLPRLEKLGVRKAHR